MIGNSSSGIIEAPYFRIPTINIGVRQNGRFFHDSIIQCDCTNLSIKKAIMLARSDKFQYKIDKMQFHFWKRRSWKKILNIIKKILKKKDKLLNKQFSIYNNFK